MSVKRKWVLPLAVGASVAVVGIGAMAFALAPTGLADGDCRESAKTLIQHWDDTSGKLHGWLGGRISDQAYEAWFDNRDNSLPFVSAMVDACGDYVPGTFVPEDAAGETLVLQANIAAVTLQDNLDGNASVVDVTRELATLDQARDQLAGLVQAAE